MISGGKEKFKLLKETYANLKPGLKFFCYYLPISSQSKNKIKKEISKQIIQNKVLKSNFISEKKRVYFKEELELELNFGLDEDRNRYKRNDIDNLIKYTLDCLKGVLFKDDCLIKKISARKFFVNKNTPECIGIRISRLSR